jgi:hypothetical protein
VSRPHARLLTAAGGLVLLLAASCGGTGIMRGTGPSGLDSSGSLSMASDSDLVRFAPILMQETDSALQTPWDTPIALDPDGSGTLLDDALLPAPSRRGRPPLYAAQFSDDARRYVFFGLYYAVDWSGEGRRPQVDHRGDFEGALVVIDRRTERLEAVVTQAHRLFYLWLAGPSTIVRPGSASGTVATTGDGRPILFAESGGHGMYAFGTGEWRPPGGRAYDGGTARVEPARLVTFTDFDMRPLSDLVVYTNGEAGDFRDLPPDGARPPWQWYDRRGGVIGRSGLIVRDPAALFVALGRHQRP